MTALHTATVLGAWMVPNSAIKYFTTHVDVKFFHYTYVRMHGNSVHLTYGSMRQTHVDDEFFLGNVHLDGLHMPAHACTCRAADQWEREATMLIIRPHPS